jgi:Endonuclease/Exonuclease/phosphatase family.
MVLNSDKASELFTANETCSLLVNIYNSANKCNKNRDNQCFTNTEKYDKLRLFHQNIRGLNNNKIEELSKQCPSLFPHILAAITEHHLNELEFINTRFDHYTLGASYCRQNRSHGGVCIYVLNTLSYSTINLNNECNNYDLEACATKLITSSNIYCILCIYKPLAGNFTTFLLHLESILTLIYSRTTNLIICGDFNVDYLHDSKNKNLLSSLLASFSLHSVVNFPTRISCSSSTIIDNIFIDKMKNKEYTAIPISNGLSDHDGQFIHLFDISVPTQHIKPSSKKIMSIQ